MWRVLVVVLYLVGLSLADPLQQQQVPLPDGRIVGGEDADIRQYPHQISMRYNGNHRCGGSILSRNTIASAAHCVATLSGPGNLTIVVGSTKLSEKAQELRVREFIVHNKYKTFNQDYDVALLLLDGDIVFSEYAKAIALAEKRPEHGTPVIVTGWGVTTEGGQIPNTLQQVEVKVVENSKCKNAYSVLLTSRMLCAAVDEGGKDACQGDSGGPLIYNNQLLGIVSWGFGCAREGIPGVYAAVPDLLDWILKSWATYDKVGSIEFL